MLKNLFSKNTPIMKTILTVLLAIASWYAVGAGLGFFVFGDPLPFFLSLMVPALIPLLWREHKKLYAIIYYIPRFYEQSITGLTSHLFDQKKKRLVKASFFVICLNN